MNIDLQAVRQWLAHIGETDATEIRSVLDECRSDPEARTYYLVKKGVLSFGLKQEEGKLLIPLQDAGGNIWSLQTIDTRAKAVRYRLTGERYTTGDSESYDVLFWGFPPS